jgi:hypothetical protein
MPVSPKNVDADANVKTSRFLVKKPFLLIIAYRTLPSVIARLSLSMKKYSTKL